MTHDPSTITALTQLLNRSLATRVEAPDARAGFLQNPQKPAENAAMAAIKQQFLQNFEYVDLFFPVSGVVGDSTVPLNYHPHLSFRMCGDERKAMNPDQRLVYLSRQIDRGTYLLKSMGFEMDDFYVDQEKGELQFDARVPNPPQGMSEEQVLRAAASQLQEECTQARANRPQHSRG